MKNPKIGQIVQAKKKEKVWGLKRSMLGKIVSVHEEDGWTEVQVKFPALDRTFTFVSNELRHVAEELEEKTAGHLNLQDTILIHIHPTKKSKATRVVIHGLEQNLTGGVEIAAHPEGEPDGELLFEFPWWAEVSVVK